MGFIVILKIKILSEFSCNEYFIPTCNLNFDMVQKGDLQNEWVAAISLRNGRRAKHRQRVNDVNVDAKRF